MLQREREVGNVFRLFRNPDEEYDNYAAPTAIKVIDHDKQRWAMLTLGDVLAQTGVWNPNVTIRVDQDAQEIDFRGTPLSKGTTLKLSERRHLSGIRNNPLEGCRIIGDLKFSQLREGTIRQAVRSIEKIIQTVVPQPTNDMLDILFDKLMALCSNNVWYHNGEGNASGKLQEQMPEYRGRLPDRDDEFDIYDALLDDDLPEIPIVFGSNIGSSAATATVEEVAEALQTAMLEAVVADEPTPEVTAKVNSSTIRAAVQDAVSITNDMSEAQRGSIASALVGAASGFKSSKSALRKVIRNKDEGKQGDVDTAYGEALKKDMASNWKNINNEAKKIAARIGVTASGMRQDRDRMKRTRQMTGHLYKIERMGFSSFQRIIARWYLGCSIDLPTIVSLDHQGIVTPFGAYVSCFYFPV